MYYVRPNNFVSDGNKLDAKRLSVVELFQDTLV